MKKIILSVALATTVILVWLLGPRLTANAAPRPRPRLWPTTRPTSPTSKPAPKRSTPTPQHAGRRYRRAIGVLGTTLCYHAYEAIKGTADGLLRQSYRRPDVQRHMTATRRTLDAARTQLVGVNTLPLAPEDHLALREIVTVLKLLASDASALGNFARTQKKVDFARFERLRQTTWRHLRKLLGR